MKQYFIFVEYDIRNNVNVSLAINVAIYSTCFSNK